MQRLELLVVIVCYRAVELTVDCLRSLASQLDDVPGTRVAICENGTGPDAVRQLNDAIERNGWNSWVTVRPVFPNRGFTGGNNVVLQDSTPRYKYFLLLNADTIVRPGALKRLVDAANERPQAGIIGPRLEWPDAEPQESAFLDFTPLHEFICAAETGPVTKLFHRRHGALPVRDKPHEAEWVSFACALIRHEVFEQCGLLDEGYYLYFDDADYCRRARNQGWEILHYPAARVVHLMGRSNPMESLAAQKRRRPRYWYVSRNRYYAKFYGRSRLWMANLLWTAGRCISLGRELVGNRSRSACYAEWRDIWINAWSPLRPPQPSDKQQA
jgi:N-acetylglucosaminyl-diphospho-decaprenol L-rhamnosyltransferase